MPVMKMILEYDGGGFHGWQKQTHLRTVQGELEDKLSLILREQVVVTGAGRTDAGCHASQQVASFRTEATTPPERIARALNGLLGGEIVVLGVAEVAEDFNARFSAISRTYRYSLAQRPTALMRERAWVVRSPLDAHAMREAAGALVGRHDFSGFSKADKGAQRNPVSDVCRAEWLERELGPAFEIEADRFQGGMVRMIVGTMVRIGAGKTAPGCVKEILEGGGAVRGGPSAPARGLCLVGVKYSRADG